MKTIAVDVWHDLLEKKLAPVAILLLAALIAVPTLLAKSPAAAPPPPPAAQTAATAGASPNAPQLQPVAQLEASDLDTYSPTNPFAPLPQLKTPEDLDVVSGSPPGGDTAGAEVPASTGGGGSTGGGSTAMPDLGGSDTGSGGGSLPRFIAPKRAPKATLYTYVVDLDFGPPGNERRRNGVARLQILPNAERPLLVFLGVSADSKQAVFLADSTASQSGEGRCEPDVETCTFIYLTTATNRNEHVVTDSEGQDYLLRLRDIRRVKVEDLKQREAARKKKANSSGARAETTGPEASKRLFGFLLFADEEQ